MKLDQRLKVMIDSFDVESLLYQWRFAPPGTKLFQGESGAYWGERLAQLRDADPAAYSAASKRIGWR